MSTGWDQRRAGNDIGGHELKPGQKRTGFQHQLRRHLALHPLIASVPSLGLQESLTHKYFFKGQRGSTLQLARQGPGPGGIPVSV